MDSIGRGFPRWLSGKESSYNVEGSGSIPGLGKSLREGNGNPLQYSCLENPMDKEAWWAAVHEVAKEWDITEQLSTHIICLLGSIPGIEKTEKN